jgi:hypothetical protein|tara:strand:- start:66140 stop:66451 length:312 start_codon:yes stop_codon:yes gene_type:complete
MPIYDFQNIETGEVEEHMMSFTKLDQFKKDNPLLKQVILKAAATIGGHISVHENKDGGFNDLMSRIGTANPTSAVADKYVSRQAKQVSVEKVLDKHWGKRNDK